MDFKIHVGHLAGAYLRHHGLDSWQKMHEAKNDNMDEACSIAISHNELGELWLIYNWIESERAASLRLSLAGQNWSISDNFRFEPISRRIRLSMASPPESVLATIRGKPMGEIISGPDWMRPALDRHHVEYVSAFTAGQGDLTTTDTPGLEYINIHLEEGQEPTRPHFKAVHSLIRLYG
jgi:hypothetical protein